MQIVVLYCGIVFVLLYMYVSYEMSYAETSPVDSFIVEDRR